MRKPLWLLILFLCSAPPFAAGTISDEDRTRFVERLYEKAEPGLRTPDEYIALAKKMVYAKYGSRVTFVDYDDGVVTYRTYRDAPKADHEMICVNFAYHRSVSSHGRIGRGSLYSVNDVSKPVLLVLMRRDLSKTYIRVVHLKPS
jgi:hypothetical protein